MYRSVRYHTLMNETSQLLDSFQARWYVKASDVMAVKIIKQDISDSGGSVNLAQYWAQEGRTFPVEGGTIGGFSAGDILGRQTPSDAEAGGNHAVQTERRQGVFDFLHLRLGDAGIRQGNPLQVELGAPGGGEILQQVGGNLRRDEEITASFPHADVANGLPGDSHPHQSAKKIPVAGAVPLKERGPQANAGRIFLIKG